MDVDLKVKLTLNQICLHEKANKNSDQSKVHVLVELLRFH